MSSICDCRTHLDLPDGPIDQCLHVVHLLQHHIAVLLQLVDNVLGRIQIHSNRIYLHDALVARLMLFARQESTDDTLRR